MSGGAAPRLGLVIGLFDTGKLPAIVETGERAALEQLPYLRELLESEA